MVSVAGDNDRDRTAAPRPGFLPASASAAIRRRGRELTGLALFATAGVLLLALFSYDPADPSWNTAGGNAETFNLIGPFGAHAADLLIQSLGAAAFLCGLVPLVWGWLMVRRKPGPGSAQRRRAIRIATLVAGVPLAATALAPLPAFPVWASQTSMGGAFGALIASWLNATVMPWGGALDRAGLTLLCTALAGLALVVALGLSAGEWRVIGRLLAWLSRRVWQGGAWAVRHGAPVAARAAQTAGTAIAQRLHRTPAEPPPRLTPSLIIGMPPVAPSSIGPSMGPSMAPRALTADPDEDAVPFDDTVPFEDTAAEPVAPVPAPPPVERRPAIAAAAPRATPASRAAPVESYTYTLPPLDLLRLPDESQRPPALSEEALRQNAVALEGVLADFGVRGEIVRINPGPVVTLYELEPAPGTKSSRVIGLADDIARSMSAVSVRVAVVPGRNVIGIELPNAKREIVYLRELLASKMFEKNPAKLAIVLGKDIGGAPVMADLARMPHLLVAGTTGSGKSVAINTMILSVLYRMPPDRARLILVDPKMLELSVYDGIPHLLTPVVTDAKKAVVALKWAVREMESRYRAMSKLGVRNIEGYNQRLAEARTSGETLIRKVQTGFDPDTGKPVFEDQPLDLIELPYIVVVVDEMADLMLVAGKDIEAAIQRLAQMARAAGIHLIMATQRPSVDVITGTIKANFPTRISFQVTSKIDSRTILGESGAEQLLGQGDMLHMAGGGRITRVHGPFVSDTEVEDVVRFLRTQGEPDYNDAVLEDDGEEAAAEAPRGSGGDDADSGNDLYDRAVALVARERKASTSFIQRHLQIGYNRAARLIERMEREGVVGQPNHVGKREVLVRDARREEGA